MNKFCYLHYAQKIAIKIEENHKNAIIDIEVEHKRDLKYKNIAFKVLIVFSLISFIINSQNQFLALIDFSCSVLAILSIFTYGFFMYLTDKQKDMLLPSIKIDEYYNLLDLTKSNSILNNYLLSNPIKKENGITDLELDAIRILLIDNQSLN